MNDVLAKRDDRVVDPTEHEASVEEDQNSEEWDSLDLAVGASSYPTIRLIIIDPPNEMGFVYARYVAEIEPDVDTWYLHSIRDGKQLELKHSISGPADYVYNWPEGLVNVACGLWDIQFTAVTVVHGRGGRLDIEILLKCLAAPFNLTVTDYGVGLTDGTLEANFLHALYPWLRGAGGEHLEGTLHLPALVAADWYLQVNPDVASASADPLVHYLSHGWREGRAPRAPPAQEDSSDLPAASIFCDDKDELERSLEAPIPPRLNPSDKPIYLILVNPPTDLGLEYGRRAAALVASTYAIIYAIPSSDGKQLEIKDGLDAAPVGRFMSPGMFPSLVRCLREMSLGSFEVIQGIESQLDLDVLADCLAVPFTLTVTDPGMFRNGQWGDGNDKARVNTTRKFAARAENIRCSSQAAIEQISRWAPELIASLHLGLSIHSCWPTYIYKRICNPDSQLRVLIWGDLTEGQGREALIRVAKTAQSRAINTTFSILGTLSPPLSPDEQNEFPLIITGAIPRGSQVLAVEALRPHVIWLPITSSAPYSLAAEDAMLSSFPLLASNAPIITSQTRGRPFTKVCALDDDALMILKEISSLVTIVEKKATDDSLVLGLDIAQVGS